MNPQWNGAPPESILVIKPSSLGDVVHTLPAVAALKKFWPTSSISWLVNPEWAPVLDGNPHLDRVHIFPRAQFRGLSAAWRMLQWARHFGREHSAELVLDFQGLLRSAMVGRFAREKQLHGLSDAREGAGFFYDSTARLKSQRTVPMHAVDRYLALVQALGVPPSGTAGLEWPLPGGPLPAGFAAGEPYVVLHPFSRGKGKSLSIPEVELFCQTMAPQRVILLGRSDLEVPGMEHVENYLNRTSLVESISILRRASWVVSVDSGPMHLAAALSPRVLSIHTWSDPRKVGPYPAEAWILKDSSIRRRGASDADGSPATDMKAVGVWVLNQLAARSAIA
jgi:ADP-heptose:LPS heptosyltransferase